VEESGCEGAIALSSARFLRAGFAPFDFAQGKLLVEMTSATLSEMTAPFLASAGTYHKHAVHPIRGPRVFLLPFPPLRTIMTPLRP